MQFDHLDTCLLELVDEVGMVPLGVVHPYHVVEEQVTGVARSQPAVREARRADQHLAQPADLGMDAERRADARGGCVRHEAAFRSGATDLLM